MCKLWLYDLPSDVVWRKETMIIAGKDQTIPKEYRNQYMKEVLDANDEMTNRKLGYIDLYCD